MGLVDNFSNGIYCAERIGDVDDANKFGLIRKERGVGFHIEIARIEHGNDLQDSTRFFGSNLPWHNIRMVLHVGDENLIASGELSFHESMRDKIDPLCRAAHKDNFVLIRRADKLSSFGTSRLVGICRLLAEIVNAAMDVGIFHAVVAVDGLNHGSGLLRCGPVIQKGQRFTPNLG